MDMISYMLPATGSVTPPAKTIDWDSFVSAMTDVGFSARHGGGSAVIFEAEDAQKGKFVFHKPHPVAKIDPIMLRSVGKRMNKWFGWIRNAF